MWFLFEEWLSFNLETLDICIFPDVNQFPSICYTPLTIEWTDDFFGFFRLRDTNRCIKILKQLSHNRPQEALTTAATQHNTTSNNTKHQVSKQINMTPKLLPHNNTTSNNTKHQVRKQIIMTPKLLPRKNTRWPTSTTNGHIDGRHHHYWPEKGTEKQY